jgi:hypothetical protein
MSDFVQLNVKRRQLNGGFLDALKEEYGAYEHDPQKIGNKLIRKVEDWLLDDEKLSHPPTVFDELSPHDIGDAISNRVCEIAGHVWLEFIEGTGEDSIRGTEYFQKRDTINAHAAEFIPEVEMDAILEAFETGSGSPIEWSKVTNENLLKLLGPLLKASPVGRKPVSPTARPAAGFLPGTMNLILPDELRGQGEEWFKDRMGADITPAWKIDEPVVITDSINQTEAGERYSFTPEHYQDADNCVTWVSRALDDLLLGNWLDTVRAHGGIAQPQCGIDQARLPHNPCEELHITDEGRMKCIEGYAFRANQRRQRDRGDFDE